MRDSTLVGIVVSGGLLGALVFAVGWLSGRGEPGQPRASWGPFEHLRGYGKWPKVLTKQARRPPRADD